MYALANVVKFLDDNRNTIDPLDAKAILGRAYDNSAHGVLSGGVIDEIMNVDMGHDFKCIATTDIVHIEIGMAALRHSNK